MTLSRWNWLLLPLSLTLVYGLMTWSCWVPLSRAEVMTKNGAAFVPYWEGQVIGFATTRVLAAALLSSLCFTMIPRRRWEPLFIGTWVGLVLSLLDRYSFDWINRHLGFLVALCAIPLVAGALVVVPFHLVLRCRGQD